MKKKLTTVFFVCLLCACLLLMNGCSKKVATPSGLRLNADTQTLTWHKVSTAKGYTVVIGDTEERTIRSNYISLEFLEPGDYEIRVRALGNGEDIEDSDWATFQYTREQESGLSYKLINNNSEYQVIGAGKATGDVVMESVYRGKPVTSIADKAFSNNTTITSMVVGENVKTIGKNAFARSAILTSVTLPESVTSIGEYAFQSCKQLKSITLPDGVTEVSNYMFSWCANLETVTLGAATTQIGEYAFSNCSKLQQITLPDTMQVVGEYAFSDCGELAQVHFGTGLQEILQYAFFNCAKLESVAFSDGLQRIENDAFGNCALITDLVIPDSCVSIGDEAFRYCYALENITLGQGLTSIGGYVFSETKYYEEAPELVVLGQWIIGTKNKEMTELEMPEGIIGISAGAFINCAELADGTSNFEGIKYVGERAFAYCKSLHSVSFDNALLRIDDYAFLGCSILKDVVLGNSLERIGAFAFYNCTQFSGDSMDLPDSLTSIGKGAFKNTYVYKSSASAVYVDNWLVAVNTESGIGFGDLPIKEGTRGIADYACKECPVLLAIVIPDSVQYIGKGAFYNTYMVQRITLPKNLKVVGDYAFYGCSSTWFTNNQNLDGDGTGVTYIPEGTEYIGRSAFYNCGTMVGVHVPGTVKTIGDYAFYGCVNLGESSVYVGEDPEALLVGDVILEEGIESIGSRVFSGCQRLVSITIPNSVTSLGMRAFYKCEKLKEVNLGTGLTAIEDYTFYGCAALETITIPETVQTIGNYAFRGCSALEQLTLPKGLEKIGNFAFYGCTGLKQIVLPDTLTTLGDYALRGCNSVTSVVIPASVTQIGKHAFYGMTKATLYSESPRIPAYWSERCNSSYRPVVWGVELSADKTYVVSFTKGAANPENATDITAMALPVRQGYVCEGFRAPDGQVYAAAQINQVPEGTVLQVIWTEKT